MEYVGGVGDDQSKGDLEDGAGNDMPDGAMSRQVLGMGGAASRLGMEMGDEDSGRNQGMGAASRLGMRMGDGMGIEDAAIRLDMGDEQPDRGLLEFQ